MGIDPGLRVLGWGVVECEGSRLRGITCGELTPSPDLPMAERLLALHEGLVAVIQQMKPDEVAIEETFVNKNPQSTLKLGMARGVAFFTPARLGLKVFEYAPNEVKKAVVGKGHAQKGQIQSMIAYLLPGMQVSSPDAADALAVAICHAHYAQTATVIRTRGHQL